MQKVEDATILSMLNSDEEKAAFEDVLYVRAKAMTAAAAGAYHTTMIKDGAMAANAVTLRHIVFIHLPLTLRCDSEHNAQ
jgi:hypothetical protein